MPVARVTPAFLIPCQLVVDNDGRVLAAIPPHDLLKRTVAQQDDEGAWFKATLPEEPPNV